ncbi:MAG TPA: hypothetical protein P5526_17775 [Anaerolineae bacterium]|nr:hypothetical protein [Anaerolineae bacterium]HRV94013.1 hypothetical protein [Anaerolineae bacterium]
MQRRVGLMLNESLPTPAAIEFYPESPGKQKALSASAFWRLTADRRPLTAEGQRTRPFFGGLRSADGGLVTADPH